MADGHTCYHCKQWVEEGEAHDCWTTTESALTAELAEDLRDAWERLREAAVELGEQRVYASHSSIMFSRKTCYFFVRPKRSFLEVNVFLGRRITSPQVRKVIQSSAAKAVHVIRVQHRDEVEAPLTDWLREAYEFNVAPRAAAPKKAAPRKAAPKTAARKKAATKNPAKKNAVKKNAVKKNAARKKTVKRRTARG